VTDGFSRRAQLSGVSCNELVGLFSTECSVVKVIIVVGCLWAVSVLRLYNADDRMTDECERELLGESQALGENAAPITSDTNPT
jgi:hypothetical protein